MKREDLIGVWELLDCEGKSTDDRSFLPYGKSPLGKLIYSSDGHMTVILMASERENFRSEDISQATNDEIKKAFESFDSYSGSWKFDEERDVVIHQIQCGRIPNWVGISHKRFCTIESGKLTLRTEQFEMMGTKWIVSVAWKRPHNNAMLADG